MDEFYVCNNFVMEFDGFKNDAAPGESFATTYGITQYTYNDALSRGIVTVPMDQATRTDCDNILRVMFWNAANCPAMPSGCNLVVYNNAMGCGVGHSVRLAQRIVGATQDGVFGPKSITAMNKFGIVAFINAMCKADEQYFAALKTAPMYLRGWDRREEECRTLALQMANQPLTALPPSP